MGFLSRINECLRPNDRPQAFYNIVALIGIPWLIYSLVYKMFSDKSPAMIFAVLAAIIVGGVMYAEKTDHASHSEFRALLLIYITPITGIFAWPWILILDIITLIRG